MYSTPYAEDSVESTFDVEKELEEVNKRLREQTGQQLLSTPSGRSPDLKRLKSQLAIGGANAASLGESAKSGAMEDALNGLPESSQPGPPKPSAPPATPASSTSEANVVPGPPSKLPSPSKPLPVSPRNLIAQLEDASTTKPAVPFLSISLLFSYQCTQGPS